MGEWKEDLQEKWGPLFPIFILETNLDDVSGEIIGNLFSLLLDAGALDVTIVSTISKKNRPGFLLKVISNKESIARLIRLIITETGTLGVRIREELRVCLKREIVEKSITLLGKMYLIHLKIAYDAEDKLIHQKIEFEDLKSIALDLKIPVKQIEHQIYKEMNPLFQFSDETE